MPRTVQLAEQVDGMSVLRIKGGASDKSLQLLKNGWITSKRTMQARPGSVRELVFPVGTVGGVGFENKFHTFASGPVDTPTDSRVVVDILKHPTGGAAALSRVHRAFAFLGRLYVVAEFADGVVNHYWIEDPKQWTASAEKALGAVIQPTTKTGYYYEALTASTLKAWQANTEVAVGESRQPKVANNLRYEITSTTGTPPPYTGNTEPAWPTTVGATVVERRYVTETTQVLPGPDTPTQPPAAEGGSGTINEEYGPFPPLGDEIVQ